MPELDRAVTTITYNEERNLPRCLTSLPRGAEVIVVDSGSTDRTVCFALYSSLLQFRQVCEVG